MIGISKLLGGTENFGDRLRYVEGARHQQYGVSPLKGPVVVWNCTNTCNLSCKHCYADSKPCQFEEELNTKEAKALIEDLGAFKVPVLLISGGEPLLRKDLFDLIRHASDNQIRSTISTNGTLIDKAVAKDLKQNGVGYVGISLDGIGERNDAFRGAQGSFDKAVAGIRNCLDIGQRVGLRFTINRNNYDELEDLFHLIKEEGIPRVCFYHLAYSGRGSSMIHEDITHEETRAAMDLIIQKAIELKDKVEILTVDNHADAPYLYLQAKAKYPELADNIWRLLQMNGGNRSGMAIANIDFKGNVHADQFTQHHTFGNIRDRKFSSIWKYPENPIAIDLRERKSLLKGRCNVCQWLSICNGNLRVRAEAITGDFWMPDPACYLTDEEIGGGQSL